MKKFNLCLTAILLSSLLSVEIFGASKYVSLGTGDQNGLYFTVGGVFSRFFAKNKKKHGVGFAVEQTAGSVYNINAVLSGKLEFGLVQSDRECQAYNGVINSDWEEKGPQKKLRSLFALFPESVTLMALARTNATHISDLKELRVNVGASGSGPLQNARDALNTFGMAEYMLKAQRLKLSKAIRFMREGALDAVFYTIGHPSSIVKLACDGDLKIRLIEISGPPVSGLLQKYPYYVQTTIPVSLYPKLVNKTDVKSVGVKAVLVASADLDADLIHTIVKEVFENLEYFKSLHPALESLTKEDMLKGFSTPIHKGALKYYEETGLIKKAISKKSRDNALKF